MKKKKIFMSAVAGGLAALMLAGCSGTGDTGTQSNQDVTQLEGTLCSAEPLTMTIHMHFWNTNVFDDSWPIYQEAAKRTNITLQGTASSASTDSNQEFNTMLTNSPLPDIIHGESKNLNKAGSEGALIPLQDLIDQYAPNIKAMFDEHPEYEKASLAADGNLYYIPCLRDDSGPAQGWFIRQDWLDKLGLEVPTTIDEYYNVLKAFREQDPNGNGEKDEIPYFDRHQSVDKLVSLWNPGDGGYSTFGDFSIDKDGNVFCARTTEGYKTAMKELAKWYAEGLIDQEIFSRQNPREQLFGDDNGGATNDWFSSTMSFNEIEKDKVPGFHIAVIAPIQDVNGDIKNQFARNATAGIGWGISKDNQHVAETMKYFDFWYTEEGSLLNAMGIEGTHYTNENGELKYTDLVMSYEGGAPNYMRTIGGQEIGYFAELGPEIAGMTEEAAAGFKEYADNGWTVKAFPSLSYTTEEERTIASKGTDVSTYTKEMQQNWIMGNADVDATWDQYIANLQSLGLDELLAAYQAAYDRQK